jgi:hypothetical protein
MVNHYLFSTFLISKRHLCILLVCGGLPVALTLTTPVISHCSTRPFFLMLPT